MWNFPNRAHARLMSRSQVQIAAMSENPGTPNRDVEDVPHEVDTFDYPSITRIPCGQNKLNLKEGHLPAVTKHGHHVR